MEFVKMFIRPHMEHKAFKHFPRDPRDTLQRSNNYEPQRKSGSQHGHSGKLNMGSEDLFIIIGQYVNFVSKNRCFLVLPGTILSFS